MLLTEYIKKYKINPVKFAVDCECSPATIYNALRGGKKMYQSIAERIEKMSDNLVTVKELRGEDDRDKRRKRDDEINESMVPDLEVDPSSYFRCD